MTEPIGPGERFIHIVIEPGICRSVSNIPHMDQLAALEVVKWQLLKQMNDAGTQGRSVPRPQTIAATPGFTPRKLP